MNNFKMITIIFFAGFLTMFFCPMVIAQTPVEINLGKGVEIEYTAPSGWTKGKGYGNEICWNSPDGLARVCLNTVGKNGSSATELLSKSIEGLTPLKCDDKKFLGDGFETVWKECQIKVGPRTEGRLWAVSNYYAARYALTFEVSIIQISAERFDKLMKSFNEIKFRYTPPAK
jgi:hypothetical protein